MHERCEEGSKNAMTKVMAVASCLKSMVPMRRSLGANGDWCEKWNAVEVNEFENVDDDILFFSDY